MSGFLRGYRRYFTVEKVIFTLLSLIITSIVKVWLLYLVNLNLRSLTSGTPWWDTKWVQEPPWGSFIYFLAVFIFVYSSIFLFWGIIQELVIIRLFRKELLRESDLFSTRRLSSFLHPYRRIKWLLEESAKRNLAQEYGFMASCNRRLSDHDFRYVHSQWNGIKKLAFLLLLGGWTLSSYKFYLFASDVIQGDLAVHNIGRYVALSFRIFVQLCLVIIAASAIGYAGHRIWSHYVELLDDLCYEVLLQSQKRTAVNDMPGSGLEEIRFRLVRLEKMVESLISALQRANKRAQ